MRVTRKHKKKLMVCSLCITGNLKERKSKYSKKKWLIIAKDFKKYCDTLTKEDRQNANNL